MQPKFVFLGVFYKACLKSPVVLMIETAMSILLRNGSGGDANT